MILPLCIGNTYQRLAESDAPLDRSGRIRKVHDCVLFVDVLLDDDDDDDDADVFDSNSSSSRSSSKRKTEDWIERVTFDLGSTFSPSQFVCCSPIPAKNAATRRTTCSVMRFSTRQQTYGSVTATIEVRGTGGTTSTYQHRIVLSSNSHTANQRYDFVEPRLPRPFHMLKMPNNVQFGIELELTCEDTTLDAYKIASHLTPTSHHAVQVFESYRAARQASHHDDTWKLVPDSSIQCNRHQPDCHKFELVSPVLEGGAGLSKIHAIVTALTSLKQSMTSRPVIRVNKSMGFHLHINVNDYSLAQLIKICQNFIKYEDVMDSFMPPSRRTSSPESKQYFQSNRLAVTKGLTASAPSNNDTIITNRRRHDALAACRSVQDLARLMNYSDNNEDSNETVSSTRYCKLNLQNLVTGRQPTIEFRQHSATTNYSKIAAWIRFCAAFCTQSARLAPPKPFRRQQPGRSDSNNNSRALVDKHFQGLFWYVVKDRALRNYYLERRLELSQEEVKQQEDEAEGVHCCGGCATGGACRKRDHSKVS